MSEKIEIIRLDDRTRIQVYSDVLVPRAAETYEIAQDPIVGDWCVVEVGDKGFGETYYETRDGAMNYVLQRCGVIEDGDWERAPDQTF